MPPELGHGLDAAADLRGGVFVRELRAVRAGAQLEHPPLRVGEAGDDRVDALPIRFAALPPLFELLLGAAALSPRCRLWREGWPRFRPRRDLLRETEVPTRGRPLELLRLAIGHEQVSSRVSANETNWRSEAADRASVTFPRSRARRKRTPSPACQLSVRITARVFKHSNGRTTVAGLRRRRSKLSLLPPEALGTAAGVLPPSSAQASLSHAGSNHRFPLSR